MKLIVGVDYGTTYTGVASAEGTAEGPKEIKTFTDWPGALGENNQHNEKTPSRIAYAGENEDLHDQDAWGYEVEPGMRNYSWTKLLLDNTTPSEKEDDPGLRTEVNRGMLRLPPGKTASQVVTDYLTKVHDHIIDVITEKCGGSDFLEVTPTEYWLTVPAIWSDQAKILTRQAALDAGFGKRPTDQINLVLEPEAAAVLTLKTALTQKGSVIELNSGVLVCDCGGGTVDITSYNICEISPRIVLNESGKGLGVKCGGSYIDRRLHSLLTKRFGSAFSSLPYDRIGPGSRFMVAFESKKQQFSLSNTRKSCKLPLKMPKLETRPNPTPGYDKRYSEIILSEQDMVECFEPIIGDIVNLINIQIQAVKQRDQPKIKTMILVGGLDCSKYVRAHLKKWCDERGVRMITPWSASWSAVARGAVLHGLGAVQIKGCILGRHYGTGMAFRYRPELDSTSKENWKRRYISTWDGFTYIPGQIAWLIAKDTLFDELTEVKDSWNINYIEGQIKQSRLRLLSHDGEEAPRLQQSPGVQAIGKTVVDFENVKLDLVPHKINEHGKMQWHLPVEVFIKLGDRQGTLTLRTQIAGQDTGVATLDISEH